MHEQKPWRGAATSDSWKWRPKNFCRVDAVFQANYYKTKNPAEAG